MLRNRKSYLLLVVYLSLLLIISIHAYFVLTGNYFPYTSYYWWIIGTMVIYFFWIQGWSYRGLFKVGMGILIVSVVMWSAGFNLGTPLLELGLFILLISTVKSIITHLND